MRLKGRRPLMLLNKKGLSIKIMTDVPTVADGQYKTNFVHTGSILP